MRFFRHPAPFKNYCLCMLMLFHRHTQAQDSLNIKFGRISIAEFSRTAPLTDTGASAVIIADIGKTYFEGNRKGNLDLVFTKFMRVKIINKNGFRIGDHEIVLFHDDKGNTESVSDLKGLTYNLEGGVIKESRLETSSVYDENYSKNFLIKKFTMPALKEGAIYDIVYTVRTVFSTNLRSWNFQGHYPCLWSEYQVTIPSAYHYKMKIQGDRQFDVSTQKQVPEDFSIEYGADLGIPLQIIHLSGNSIQLRWVKKNVTAIKQEPYESSPNNYVDRVSFQLAYFQINNKEEKQSDYSSWTEASKRYFANQNMEEAMESDNVWMDGEIKKIAAHTENQDQLSRAIFYFVRDNFICKKNGTIYAQNSLKDVFKNRTGNSAEINLLLVAMLRHAKIYADAAILSTRENGFASLDYPLMSEYNYLIAIIYDGDKVIKLDVSQPRIPFGNLLPECYNGGARILDKSHSRIISLSPDSITEKKLTNVIIAYDEKAGVSGNLTTTFGTERSYEIREEIRKSSKEDYFRKNLVKTGENLELVNEDFDSLDRYDEPLKMHCDLEFRELTKPDVIYLKPVMASSMTTNPFTATERRSPVELPYKTDNLYLLSMDIPKGFQVDEMPKSTRIKLNGDEGVFEYIVQQNTDNIQMQVRLTLNRTNFPTDEYNSVREFFGYVVKKESEEIVLKKIR